MRLLTTDGRLFHWHSCTSFSTAMDFQLSILLLLVYHFYSNLTTGENTYFTGTGLLHCTQMGYHLTSRNINVPGKI